MDNSTFQFNKPEDSPGLLLWQTTITWQRLIKKELDHFQTSHAQFVILAILLWFVEHNQLPTQLLIVNLSKLDKMTVSKSLKKLTALKLLKRNELKNDTRIKTILLTDKGIELTKKLVKIVEKIDSNFFGKISLNDQNKFKQISKQLMILKDET